MKEDPIGVLIDGETQQKRERPYEHACVGYQSRCVAKMKKPAPIEITIRRRKEQSHDHDDDRHAFFVIFETKWVNKCPMDVMKFPEAQAKKRDRICRSITEKPA